MAERSGAEQKKKPRGRPFAKGVSGNPGGTPKALADVIALARSHTEVAIAALAQIATSGESEGARVAASNALLDRAWGKPKDTVAIEGTDGAPLGLTVTVVRARE